MPEVAEDQPVIPQKPQQVLPEAVEQPRYNDACIY